MTGFLFLCPLPEAVPDGLLQRHILAVEGVEAPTRGSVSPVAVAQVPLRERYGKNYQYFEKLLLFIILKTKKLSFPNM